MRRALLLCLALVLLPCAPAGAVSISYELLRSAPGAPGDKYNSSTPPSETYALRVTGEAEERNDLQFAQAPYGPVRVRDDAAAARLGPGCAADAEGWVTCTPPQPPGHDTRWELRLATGDGDDRVRGSGGRIELDLGAGADVAELHSTFGPVTGGAGDDALAATTDGPSQRPAAYLDSVSAPVTWDGGPGADRVAGDAVVASYAARTGPVSVTPDGVADDGEPGEHDDVAPDVGAIQGGNGDDRLTSSGWIVLGGPGADVLTGAEVDRPGRPTTAPQEVLVGAGGDDVLVGRGGRDELDGGAGNDRLDGGDGDDELRDRSGRDRMLGGAGDDRLDLVPDRSPDDAAGGDGRDRLFSSDDYATARLDVRLSLDGRANDGTLGEGDDIHTDWESLEAVAGTLIGSDRDETLALYGGGRIDAGGGDDVVSGGEIVSGGPGRDRLVDVTVGSGRGPHALRIDVRDGTPDDVTCAAFVPATELRRDRTDRIHRCFALAKPVEPVPRRPIPRGSRLPVRLSCAGPRRCRGRLSVTPLSKGARSLGSTSFDVRPRGHARVHIRLRSGFCERVELRTTTRSPYTPGETREYRQFGGPTGSC